MAAVLNRTTEMQQEMGLSDQDLMAVRLHYDTAKPALTLLQKQAQPMQAFENTLLTNIDRFQDIAKNLGTTNSRWINIPITELMQNTGNTDISKLNVRLKALQTETAKIMSGSMGNQVLSDFAQKEQEVLTDKNMSLGQMIAATNEIKDEIKNARMKSMGDQIKNLTQSIINPLNQQKDTPAPLQNKPMSIDDRLKKYK